MRVGILGAGGIARSMASTLRAMRRSGENVELYAVASRDEARARTFAERETATVAYGSYEAMLQDENVDLVYIATPHSHHAEQMHLCLAYGKPVLCEKAFTGNAGQAASVLQEAEEKKILVTEAIWTRYMPSRQMLRDLIQAGEIGEVTGLRANLGYRVGQLDRLRLPELAGGALLDMGVYCLNFAAMVLGAPDRIRATGVLTETGVDLSDSISLVYPNQVVADLYTSMATNTDRSGIVYGSKGYLWVDNINNIGRIEVWRPDHSRLFPERILPVPQQLTGYEYQVRSCMHALADGEIECPEMPHAEILQIMREMDEIRGQLGVRYPFD